MQHPINAIRVGAAKEGGSNISSTASNFAINIQNTAGLPSNGGGEGDHRNAMRHTLWQGIITNEMGESHANRIGNAHENNLNVDLSQRTFNNMADADKVVDLLNNQIGREIGKQNKGASNQIMAEKMATEFYKNGLWTASENKEGGISIQRTRLTEEQYNSAIEEIRRKNENGMNR